LSGDFLLIENHRKILLTKILLFRFTLKRLAIAGSWNRFT
jgi:hypothetical protein